MLCNCVCYSVRNVACVLVVFVVAIVCCVRCACNLCVAFALCVSLFYLRGLLRLCSVYMCRVVCSVSLLTCLVECKLCVCVTVVFNCA